MKNDTWIIESRTPSGELLLTGEQPEHFFGLGAIHGITEDEIAQRIFAAKDDAVMHGGNIPNWPKLINLNWTARRKTW